MQVKGNQYIYTDISGLQDLKNQANNGEKQGAIREVAKQFESLFMNMMLKSMRDASMGDPIFDSSQSLVYRDMFDRQLALSMSKGQGMGLAEVLSRQLMQQVPGTDKDVTSLQPMQPTAYPAFPTGTPFPAKTVNRAFIEVSKSAPPLIEIDMTRDVSLTEDINSPQERFIRELWPTAVAAAEELDTLPEVLISQAALETGWGKYISKDEQGNNSFNLFNIKAGPGWGGKIVEKTTIEYHQGNPVREVAKFRAYDSYEDSFRDYVDFLKSNDRYGKALRQAANPEKFIHGLHRAGYATDPDYANKILNIINREWDVFNKTISLYAGTEDYA